MAGTWVRVPTLPECDICKFVGPSTGKPARYDGKTVQGPWANMCEDHWESHGVGRLGVGSGQRLLLEGETTE